MNTTKVLSENLMRALALMQFNGDDFFILWDDDGNGKAYEGTEEEAREQFAEDIEGTEEADIDANFEIFCSNNLTEVEEIDGDDYNEKYLVLTDSEADEKWDESLQNYLDECIYPELPDMAKNYFDDDAWKADARHDGRGHSLASYDGHENEETIEGETFYIYRIN